MVVEATRQGLSGLLMTKVVANDVVEVKDGVVIDSAPEETSYNRGDY